MPIRSLSVAVLMVGLTTPAFAQEATTHPDARKAVEELAAAYDNTFNKHDAAGMVALFDEEPIVVIPGPIVSGKRALQQQYQDAFDAGARNHLLSVERVEPISENALLAAGTWRVMGTAKDGKFGIISGKWTEVQERHGQVWKIKMLAYNTTPAEPSAVSGTTSVPK